MTWFEIDLIIIAYTVFACVFIVLFTFALLALDGLSRWIEDSMDAKRRSKKAQ